MRRGRINPKWFVYLIVFGGIFLFTRFFPGSGYIRPGPWEISTSAGVGALDAGKLDEAERHFLQASEEAKSFKPDDRRRGTSVHNLAYVRLLQKRYADAEPLYRDALPRLEAGGLADEAELGNALTELAVIRVHNQDLQESESLLRRAISVNERARGKNHPVVAHNYLELASVLLGQGKGVDSAAAAMHAAEITRNREPASTRPLETP